MSIWYPSSGISYQQYLQANSFAKDITGQVKISSSDIEAKVSEQTKELVASNQQLATIFGESFSSLNDSLEWGFDRISSALEDVSYEIESLHSDFNYNMALLIDEVRINNKLFTDLINKLDIIHKTLESPTLTQAREFYNIGCERLSKGLLDKALQAFLESEKKNDTDFFTQYHIGKLYLYGVDEDDNVINLEEAKKHLLEAARYAKAEISIDSNFSKFAAEALLHASISLYAMLGENKVKDDGAKINLLLIEAKKLISEAIKMYKDIPESFYHLAKYASLLNDPELSIQNLESAIVYDRNYAVKVDIDHAFDPIRPYVHKLLFQLKESKKIECYEKIREVLEMYKEAANWHPEKRETLSEQFSKCTTEIKQAKNYYDTKTYFGFLDSISLLIPLMVSLSELKTKCIEEFRNQVRNSLNDAINHLPTKGIYTLEVENYIDEVNVLITNSEKHLSQESYDSFNLALSIAESANLKASSADKLAREQDHEERLKEKIRIERKELQERRNRASSEYAGRGAIIGAIILGLTGCVSCLSNVSGKTLSETFSGFNLFSGALVGAILGAIFGAVLGQSKN